VRDVLSFAMLILVSLLVFIVEIGYECGTGVGILLPRNITQTAFNAIWISNRIIFLGGNLF
jgi:hypothetical protein